MRSARSAFPNFVYLCFLFSGSSVLLFSPCVFIHLMVTQETHLLIHLLMLHSDWLHSTAIVRAWNEEKKHFHFLLDSRWIKTGSSRNSMFRLMSIVLRQFFLGAVRTLLLLPLHWLIDSFTPPILFGHKRSKDRVGASENRTRNRKMLFLKIGHHHDYSRCSTLSLCNHQPDHHQL